MGGFRVAFSFAAAVALSGCGGQIIMGTGDAGAEPVTSVVGSSPGSEDAGTDGAYTGSNPGNPGGAFPECPGQQPEAGETCTTPNQGCAYVNIQNGSCVSWTCSASGAWYSSTPAGC
jgi:hypothetical protein